MKFLQVFTPLLCILRTNYFIDFLIDWLIDWLIDNWTLDDTKELWNHNKMQKTNLPTVCLNEP